MFMFMVEVSKEFHEVTGLRGSPFMLVSVCARLTLTNIRMSNTHRVHLPTLGLDGQVYVCMCMGRYSV